LEVIHADEVTHVSSGHRWFTWICQQGNVDPIKTFREEVRKGWRGDIKGPFNAEDRERAGLSPEFYEDLRGELGLPSSDASSARAIDVVTEQMSVLDVKYEK
jgi:uncharacterized ferritin-like protein (DUF455 family)